VVCDIRVTKAAPLRHPLLELGRGHGLLPSPRSGPT
jgi:hypothetical protein